VVAEVSIGQTGVSKTLVPYLLKQTL
jgi:hypothetical protein